LAGAVNGARGDFRGGEKDATHPGSYCAPLGGRSTLLWGAHRPSFSAGVAGRKNLDLRPCEPKSAEVSSTKAEWERKAYPYQVALFHQKLSGDRHLDRCGPYAVDFQLSSSLQGSNVASEVRQTSSVGAR